MTKTLNNEQIRDDKLIYIPRLQPQNDNCNASFYDYDYGNHGDIGYRRSSQEYEVYTPDVRPNPDGARQDVGDNPTYDVSADYDVIPEYEATGHVPSQLAPQQAEQLLAYSSEGSTLALR